LLIDVDRILSWFQTELPVREKIFLLLDATQTSLGGTKARFPQYYDAYYELVVGIIFNIFSLFSFFAIVLRILLASCQSVGIWTRIFYLLN